MITTKTQADADEVKAALEQDDSTKSWEAVAKKYSIDEATKNTGGLREAVVEGQSEPVLDEAIFTAPEGELVGPLEGDAGFYVLQVDAVTPAATQPLDPPAEADPERPGRASAPATRSSRRWSPPASRRSHSASRTTSPTKWKARTFCAAGYEVDRCSNAPAAARTSAPRRSRRRPAAPPSSSSRPVAPLGSRGVFGSPAATLLPQGPITPAAAPSRAASSCRRASSRRRAASSARRRAARRRAAGGAAPPGARTARPRAP